MSHTMLDDEWLEPTKDDKLATGALICSVLGVCMFPIGLVGAFMGIVARRRAVRDPEKYAGPRRALAAIVLGVAGSLTCMPYSVAVLLPAFGRARMNAKEIVSAHNLKVMGSALQAYAADHGGYPEHGADVSGRLAALGLAEAKVFASPFALSADPPAKVDSYLYRAPLDGADPSTTIVVVENPDLGVERLRLLYLDGRVWTVPEDQVAGVVKSLGGFRGISGAEWTPAGTGAGAAP